MKLLVSYVPHFFFLHLLNILIEAVFAREFAGARKMVDLLVLLQAAKRVAFQVAAAPYDVELRAVRMCLFCVIKISDDDE